MKGKIAALSVRPGLELFHTGPSLDHGPLPSIFYFSLSGPDSLGTDPYNQPVQFLKEEMIRVFSLTLPAHENDLSPRDAVQTWAEDYAKGQDPLGTFFQECQEAISFAIGQKFVDPEKMGLAGLSRGALVAFHLAALDPRFRFILAFAPLTSLGKVKEFSHTPYPPYLEAKALCSSLFDRHIRLYIGNHDTRVDTRSCFEFAMTLAETAHAQNIRTPQIECYITPSIGHGGHGTAPHIFQEGAAWLASSLTSKR